MLASAGAMAQTTTKPTEKEKMEAPVKKAVHKHKAPMTKECEKKMGEKKELEKKAGDKKECLKKEAEKKVNEKTAPVKKVPAKK